MVLKTLSTDTLDLVPPKYITSAVQFHVDMREVMDYLPDHVVIRWVFLFDQGWILTARVFLVLHHQWPCGIITHRMLLEPYKCGTSAVQFHVDMREVMDYVTDIFPLEELLSKVTNVYHKFYLIVYVLHIRKMLLGSFLFCLMSLLHCRLERTTTRRVP